MPQLNSACLCTYRISVSKVDTQRVKDIWGFCKKQNLVHHVTVFLKALSELRTLVVIQIIIKNPEHKGWACEV